MLEINLLNILMLALAIEAATNLITKSEFSTRFIKAPLFKLRHIKVFNFIHDILDCGYCTSVWVAFLFAGFSFIEEFKYVVLILILHRLSNILHFIIDLIDEKRPRDFSDFSRKGEDYEGLRKEYDESLGSHDEKSGGSGTDDSIG